MPTSTPISNTFTLPSFQQGYEFLQIFLVSDEWQVLLLWVKIFGFLFTAALIIGIVILIVRLNIIGDGIKIARDFLRPMKPKTKAHFQKRFERAKQRLRQGTEGEDRLAVLEADRILEDALESVGYKTGTVTEKLNAVKPWHVKNVSEVKRAHEIRNRIVHEPGATLTHFEAEDAVKIYEAALKELGVLS